MECAEFKAGGLRCLIGANGEQGEHRAGYNGVWRLTAPGRRRSAFVPLYAGLNLEHYFDGFHDRRNASVLFEPRRAPMQFQRLGPHSALLYQPPTPFWQVESWTTFAVREPCYIDMEFCCIPRKRTFKNGILGAFWASYINQPESKAVHFRGAKSPRDTPRWLSFESARHGEQSSVRGISDRVSLPLHPEIQRFMYASLAPLRYDEPYYYGLCRDHMILLMFDCDQVLRFAHSPSGGGQGNPAWDFYLLVPGYEVGRKYALRTRLCYKPFVSRRDAAREFAAWKRALEG